MLKSFLVFLDGPFVKVRVDIFPHECSVIVRRVAEIVHFVTVFAEFIHYIWEILVSPAACYVYLCHGCLFDCLCAKIAILSDRQPSGGNQYYEAAYADVGIDH